jgi:hypothetical protein
LYPSQPIWPFALCSMYVGNRYMLQTQLYVSRTVPEFIDPVLGMKTLVFAKTCPKRSFSIQSVPRDAGFSLFWMRLDLG